MNDQYNSVDEIIAAYQSGKLARDDVARWLRSRQQVQQEQHASSGHVHAKPDNILLASLDGATFCTGNAAPVSKPVVTLAALDARPGMATSVAHTSHGGNDGIEIYSHGDGVYALVLQVSTSLWTAALVAALRDAFAAVGARADARVLLLKAARGLPDGGDDVFFAHAAPMLPLDFALPVVAVVPEDTRGAGWLFASLCDFLLCAEEGRYGYADRGAAEEAALVKARYRIGDAHGVFLTGAVHEGRQLRAAGLGLHIVPRARLDDAAQALARQVAAAPLAALTLLKRHLARELRVCTQAVMHAWRGVATRAQLARFTATERKSDWPAILPPSEQVAPVARDAVRAIDICSDVVHIDIDAAGVVLITMADVARCNAFTAQLVEGVGRAFAALAREPQARVAVVTGAGPYFSTGGTRESLLAIQAGRARFTDIDIYSLPATAPLPVIAAMQGHGVGAGWAFAMFCDFVVCSVQHQYSSPYMRYGFTPGAGATLVFPEKFGLDLARETLFGAGSHDGAALRERGAPWEVQASAAVLPRALSIAAQLAQQPRATLAALKLRAGKRLRASLADTLAQEQAMHAQCFVGSSEVLARIDEHFGDAGAKSDAVPAQVREPVPQANGCLPIVSAEDVLAQLHALLATELMMQQAEIALDQKFIDIGLDSITGVNWVRRINEQFGLAINATAIYRHPTLCEFAAYVGACASEEERTPAAVPVAAPSARPPGMETAEATEAAANGTATLLCVVPVEASIAAPVPPSGQPIVAVRPPQAAGVPHTAPPALAARPPKIAVVGMAGQFPKARDLAQFWHNLAEGRDCISEVPPERWSTQEFYDADREQRGKSYSRWMGCLDDVAAFDPQFFGISPREAEWMDPQQRLFLQAAWHCVEDAAYDASALSGSRCGVFVGCTEGDYSRAIARTDLNAQNFMGRAASILSSRIAYLLDLQGPCMAIDTACSSSLVALASACESLATGACDMALAGGVCVLAGPDMHIMTSKAGMLSPDGRCYSFDERANGFVPGEGVGVLLLKRLEDAERDGDPIHGVIAGWGVNQDGKTNGITAPNPHAQARLAQQVYRRFLVDPDTIELVEAHGTGTRLGDPIEVEGLKEAFGAFTTRRAYCALGSVKSNIGHALAAAGIAGTIKLLLALRHGLMPATLHVQQVNSHIELAGTPFHINDRARPWPPSESRTRRAAVSSFGFSGTNAHVVVEEYTGRDAPSHRAAVPAQSLLVPLSARDDVRLRELARNLARYLAQPDQAHLQLADIAHTMQTGRQAMAVRLVIEATSRDALQAALDNFAAGGQPPAALAPHAAAWVRGEPVDWHAHAPYAQPGSASPRRINLPGYPFERTSYWLPVTGSGEREATAGAPVLHPLVHANTSTLDGGQRYSSSYTGREFFLDQHVIMRRKVLPGVAHLEMVRAAMREACGSRLEGACLRINNVVWMRPVVGPAGDAAADRAVVHIALRPGADGAVTFSIFSGGEHADQPAVVHSQGCVEVCAAPAVAPLPVVDLAALRAQCSDAVIDAAHHFDAMRERGADLGVAFRGIRHYYLCADANGMPFSLAHIFIPAGLADGAHGYVLHPTAMDAAVHTAPPLMAGWRDAKRIPLALPFALEELEVLGSCQEEMWALARPAAGAAPTVLKYDIDLLDDAGMVCARFKGLSFKVVEHPPAQPESVPAVSLTPAAQPAMVLAPGWVVRTPTSRPTLSRQRIVVLCGLGPAAPWRERFPDADVQSLDRLAQADVTDMTDMAGLTHDVPAVDLLFAAFALVQQLLLARRRAGASGPVLLQFVAVDPRYAALSGLAAVMRREHPRVAAQVVLAESDADIVRQVDSCQDETDDVLLRCRGEVIEGREWTAIARDRSAGALATSPHGSVLPWRESGVYLITGGSGTLAMLFAAEILQRTARAQVILCGRSPLDEALRARLAALAPAAAESAEDRVRYMQVDVADRAAVTDMVDEVRARYRRLDGVLHCAGVLQDSAIVAKTAQQVRAVMAPKVAGLLNLEHATATSPCDFLVLFSSIAAVIGTAGQADYALANAYLDAHAATVSSTRRTLSINWSLWQDGGMTLDAQSLRWMADNTGLTPLASAAGIEAFYRALDSGASQALVLSGDAAAMARFIPGMAQSPPQPLPPAESTAMQPTEAHVIDASFAAAATSRRIDDVLDLLRPAVGEILKITPAQLALDKEFISYGFDSISLTELTNKLNARYKIATRRALNPTIFFEHPTLRSFAAYLAHDYPEVAPPDDAATNDTPATPPAAARAALPELPELGPAPAIVTAAAMPKSVHTSGNLVSEPLAVVGISGRFPMANDIRAYWRNLVEGRDCISEVPEDRWDWRAYYGDPAADGDRTDVRYGGFIDGVAEFDPLFFGISPREALYMDPMQRLLMQHTWHAIEDAGYRATALAGTRTAIFVGTSVSEYGMLLQKAGVPCDAFLPTGRSASLGANRMSYLLNISGPSETIDTACSSSLVAIHRAVQAIEAGQADMALVGGVNVLIAPDGHISFRKAGMLSEDGRCKTFSAAADGYARGEGVGMLFLKKLSDAQRDGDHIYGLVRGSGENHGGRANSLTAPNPKAQAELLRSVYTQAGIDPRTVGFIEAHGTGTPLGDPVEVNALKTAFRDLYEASGDARAQASHCGIGSAKSNIGHLELAAGVAGAIKVLLQLKHRTRVRTLHAAPLNPYIDLQGTPFHVVDETAPWPAPVDAAGRLAPRRAGVSSFGFGGANAHVVFEEYLPPQPQTPVADNDRERMFVLSARTAERLVASAQQLLAALDDEAPDLDSLAYTLQVGREAYEERLGFVAATLAQVKQRLSAFIAGEPGDALYRGRAQHDDALLALFDGDELQDTVVRWVARGQYRKLAAVWVKGAEIDWQALYPVLPRRASLPGYPFARERHWPVMAASATRAAAPPLAGAPADEAAVGILPSVSAPPAARSVAFLHKQWLAQPLERPAQPDAVHPLQALVLANNDTLALAHTLAVRMKARIVNLDDAGAADAQAGGRWAGVIDLTACGQRAVQPSVLLPWLQRVAQQRDAAGPVMLLGVSCGLESLENPHINLAGAATAGLYRMLGSEYANLCSRQVDLDPRSDDAVRVTQVLDEWRSYADAAQVCYRRGVRHVAQLAEMTAPSAAPAALTDNSLQFEADEVLWITGGTRGLGLLCARHFVARYGVRKLVLTGREALPPAAQWQRYFDDTDPAHAPLRRKLAAIEALRQQGVAIEVLTLDSAATLAVTQALARITATMGRVAGVLHCAGINDFDHPAFVRKTADGFAAVLAPKVAGLDALLDAMRPEPLRFVALFSSVAATVPALAAGQSDYACANTYMDYVAQAQAGRLPIVSIEWPSWKETGMGEATTRSYRDSGMLSVTDAEGLRLLDRVLAGRMGPVVLPAMVDRSRWQPQRLMARGLAKTAPLTVQQAADDVHDRNQDQPVAPATEAAVGEGAAAARSWLASLFAKELMVAAQSLDHSVPFQDYGVDSIMLTQILRRVDAALAAHGKRGAMDPSVFYEYPTLAAFADYLLERYPAELVGAVGANEQSTVVERADSVQPAVAAAPAIQRDSIAPEAAGCAAGNTEAHDIAIVGMACRLPGADDIDAYWRLLAEGRSAIGEVPAWRWQAAKPRHAGLLANTTHFDPGYFLLGEEDAKVMDPQALLLMEQALAAILHAGYSAAELKGSATGVFIGARSTHRPPAAALALARNPIVAVGQNYLAANISHYFDLQGPSLVLDTACSSALVAAHMAVRALRAGEIGAALVGAASLLASDEAHQLFEQRKLLSADGEFHLFDARAVGAVIGEGAGVVMLKTVAQARADGDCIHAVIKGMAINNDGRTAGPATPNLAAHKAVMRAALADSGVRPDHVGYLHVNGSGSEVTDLLELKAVQAVYRPHGGSPCELGSVEPNIGHPLCAKGIAGLIAVTLMLANRQRPPFLSAQQPMAHYRFDESPLRFGRTLMPWPDETPYAALSCFADGGTNAHLVLAPSSHARAHAVRRQSLPMPPLQRRPVYASAAHALVTPPAWPLTEEAGVLRLTADHPVLRGHLAYGQRLLPGLAYIDILYQHFTSQGLPLNELALRRLSIYQPLTVEEGREVRLAIRTEQRAPGHWQVWLEDRGDDAPGDGQAKRYAVAEMLAVPPVSYSEVIDLKEVRQRARSSVALSALYAQCTRQGLAHDGAIKAEGWVHESADATVIELGLGTQALGEATAYRFHPALIDGSSVGAQRLFAAFFEGEQRLILPLFYDSFHASAALSTRCTTRIPAASLRRKNELLYMDMDFFDEAGVKVAELRNYACKLVRDESAINPQRRGQAAAVAVPAPDAATAADSIAAAPARSKVETARETMAADGGQHVQVERYLARLMAARLGVPAEQIDTGVGYYELGLDSARLLDLVAALEARLGATLAPTLLFEYTTIAELAQYLLQAHPGAWHGDSPLTTDGGARSGSASGEGSAGGNADDRHDAGAQAHSGALSLPLPANGVCENDIAIIGMAGRYPGADTLEQFWDQLRAGTDCVTEVPPARWERARLADVRSPSGKPMSHWGGFINDPDCFDAQFFRVSPWEAKLLDPQQRQFLEVCWEAIEDAGYTPRNLAPARGRHQRRHVGVYAGVMHNDYALLTADAMARGGPMPVSLNYAQIANRVSYFCNFHGPSMAIDTVCSSSLIAVHMAVQSLRNGETDVAIAGGVNLSLHPVKYLTYGLMDMHASDGRCRAFGKGGDGYVSGEGVGAVVLKPLAQAVRDGDHVYAVIKGSVTNHVGAVSGLTVPSPVAQADMIEQCLEKAGIDPRTISYVEAHGTGTSLGDPIELQGLVKAFGRYTNDRQFCAIGSVKSNIGHAESAAGISGLTKLALQLHHCELAPSLHAEELNPYLDFANSPFYVQRERSPWVAPRIKAGAEVVLPRRAALSSFGASGSNAHMIVEEYLTPAPPARPARPLVAPLSAKKADRLQAMARRLLAWLERHGETLALADVCYTLQTGREAMAERVAFVASDIAGLRAQLNAYVQGAPAGWHATVSRQAGGGSAAAPLVAADTDPAALAQAWVAGASIDWQGLNAALFGDIPPRRVSLPAYPFARDRHWLDTTAPAVPVRPAGEPSLGAGSDAGGAPQARHAPADIVYFAPGWQRCAASPSRATSIKTTVFAIGAPGLALPGVAIYHLGTEGTADEQIERHAAALLAYCQDSDRIRAAQSEQLLVYAPYGEEGYPYRSLSGALRTMAIELPFIEARLILDAAIEARDREAMRTHLDEEMRVLDGHPEVAYPPQQPRQVLVQQLIDSVPDVQLADVVRRQGVYLITGGLGGLGRLFAARLGKAADARIVLSGRSALDRSRQAALDALRAQGVNADYIVCDTSVADDVHALVAQVQQRYGVLHGVVHSAGVLADNFMPKATVQELHAVLAAKASAIIHLDAATANIALDFFVGFSSSAALGNAGQFAYALANAFLDSFAARRASLAARGERHGRSLSINWPLWQDGGMTVQPVYAQLLRAQYGVVPLQDDAGVASLGAALASTHAQFGVFQGERTRIAALLTAAPRSSSVARPALADGRATGETAAHDLAAPAARRSDDSGEQAVRAAVGEVLGMVPDAIDADVSFADYGMDSIGATKIAALLNSRLGLSLSGAVFLELDTVRKLADYLGATVARVDDAGAACAAPPAPAAAATRLSGEPASGKPATADLRQPSGSHAEPGGRIAIIGYDACLPGAADVDSYWQQLKAGAIAIDDADRTWLARGVCLDPLVPGDYGSMRHAALLSDIDRFDAGFWGIDEQTVRAMDPQQRLLMRSIWRCVEQAGIPMDSLTQGRVGLFVALDSVDYQELARARGVAPAQQLTVGMIVNQVSYYCNFTGPSEAIDNACASTYVALKRAAQALAAGECDTAIVGGAKILLDPAGFLSRDEGEILSRSGRMYPFDARADGYVRGEGVGCVLLKQEAQARQDGDAIHALVAGIGVTHNGRSALSQVAPSVDGQYRAIHEAYRKAGFDPGSVGYIEAHGTANSFSDAAEVAAFKRYFKEAMTPQAYQEHRCAISSVKANIGHLEGASGIASLIKAVCALREGLIAPIATWSAPHPSILLEHSPFHMPTTVTPWECGTAPRRAGLHSIGIGGVNAHVLLEEGPRDHAARRTPLPPYTFDEKRYWLPDLARASDPFEALFHETFMAPVADQLQPLLS